VRLGPPAAEPVSSDSATRDQGHTALLEALQQFGEVLHDSSPLAFERNAAVGLLVS
jgi:hypothetical protein